MKLKSSEQNENSKIVENITDALCGIILGGSFFAVLLNIFKLNWSFETMLRGGIKGGFLSTANTIADYLGNTNYIILEKFKDGYDGSSNLLPNGLFLTFALMIIIVISCIIVRSCSKWFLSIYVIPVIILTILIDDSVNYMPLFSLAAALFLSLVAMTNSKITPYSFILPFAAVIITSAIVFTLEESNFTSDLQFLEKISEKVQETTEKRYGEDPLKNGKLDKLSSEELREDRGSIDQIISSLKDGKDGSDTAFTVEREGMESYYLKGFIGEKFDENRWNRLDTEIHYENRENLYWLNKEGFDGLSQISIVKKLVDGATPRSMKIEVKNAGRKNMLIPYELTGSDKKTEKGFENYSGAYLGTGSLFGRRNYQYAVEKNLTSTWTKWVGKLYSGKIDEAAKKYFINESHQNVFNYKNYTKYPKSLERLFEKEIGETGDIRKNHAEYGASIYKIRKYLQEKYIYTDYFTKDDKWDEVTNFIKKKKGVDAHFATLGTLLFRYYGIPARYVEGYLVTPSDAKGNRAVIGRSHNHAWTEIYIDGYGWVPIEVTPSYRGIMKEADLKIGLESVKYESKLNVDNPPDRRTVDESKNESESTGNIIRRLWGILGIIIIILLLYKVMYKLIPILYSAWKRHRAFNDKDPKEGTKAIFRYIKKEGLFITEENEALGNYAVYSLGEVAEEGRRQMKEALKRGKNEKRKIKKNNRSAAHSFVSNLFGRLRKKQRRK